MERNTMPSILPRDDSHWHELRRTHVGASESAALFGLSPWLTPWQLYHIKRGALPGMADNDVLRTGRHFEPAIASYAAEKFDLRLQKVHRYISDDTTPGMGASLDYETAEGERMPAEIKMSLFGDGWEWEGDRLTSAPEHYVIQCQHQIAVTGAKAALLIAWAGFNVRTMLIPRSDAIVAELRARITQFWADVKAGNEPPVDFQMDGDELTALAATLRYKDVSIADPDFALLCEMQKDAAAAAKAAAAKADEMKARILKRVMDEAAAPDGDAKVVVRAPGYKISLTPVADSPGKTVTTDMVGTTIGGRKGYLRTTITPVSEEK